MLNKLHGPILILGSRVLDSGSDYKEVNERLASLFPYNIEISPPEDESCLMSWKSQFEEDMKKIQIQDNRNHIMEVLAANDLDCDDLDSICVADTVVLSNYIEEIVQREEGALVEPEKKAENPASDIKAESDTSSTSVVKTDGENAVPESKVHVAYVRVQGPVQRSCIMLQNFYVYQQDLQRMAHP
ncbi:hypothetical protein JHK85_002630 [Glycine max]|nr:hypothetical protein JHK85_002630 [Glycine max]